MFGELYNQVFPVLIDFFSKLVSLSTTSVYDLIALEGTSMSIDYVNLLTGVSSSFTIASGTTAQLLSGAFSFIFFSVDPVTPLWLALIICFVEVFVAVSLIKFIRDFIT